jgi:RNA polymerase sigma-54 factor
MQARLALGQEQRFALQPEMLQSLEVLQLAADELRGVIERELDVNETLMVRRRRCTPTGDNAEAALRAAVAPGGDLRASLQVQLAWRQCPPALTAGVLALADLLDERGLLPQSDGELAAALGADVWLDALGVLQTLEPRGLGARTAVEAMLLQLPPGDPDGDDIAALLGDHLDALARQRGDQVALALGLEFEDVQRLLARVKELNPRPGAPLAVSNPVPVRVELEAWLADGRVVVRARGGDLPELAVHPRYAALAHAGHGEVRAYLRPKLAAARSLIRAVEQRQRTLVRVGAAVMSRQSEFLQHGVRALRALRMAEIAADLDCHVSTVSRAIAGKWVDTAHGVFALRRFFDGAQLGAPSAPAAAGAALSVHGVRARVQELFAAEDRTHPLSDDDVADLLARQGIVVARRTIAKYRAELGVPSRWRRRSPR